MGGGGGVGQRKQKKPRAGVWGPAVGRELEGDRVGGGGGGQERLWAKGRETDRQTDRQTETERGCGGYKEKVHDF